jgi:membrane associated rhomboid family serine protease
MKPPLLSRSAEPMFNLPGVVLCCVLVLVGIHTVLWFLPEDLLVRTVFDFGFIPAQWSLAWSPSQLSPIIEQAGRALQGADKADLGAAVLAHARLKPWTAVTYAFLHGSWSHLVLNVLWLAAFGSPVARRIGAARLLLLALAGALGGAAAHLVTNAYSFAPMIGASAVVSALMGSAAHFVFARPRNSGDRLERRGARGSWGELLLNRSALAFLGLWFVSNLLFGLGAAGLGITESGIAWEAHVGGLLAGLGLFPLLDPVHRRQG